MTGDRVGPRIGLRFADQLRDAWFGLAARPARTVASVVITSVGVAAAVGVQGIGFSGGRQIATTFDEFRATTIRIDAPTPPGIGPDAETRIRAVGAVTTAGRIEESSDAAVTTLADDPPVSVQLFEVTAGAVRTLGLTATAGADRLPEVGGAGTALVGAGLAARLGLDANHLTSGIWVDGVPVTVIGIVAATRRLDGVANGLVLAPGGLERVGATVTRSYVLAGVELGAAQAVGQVAAAAVDPAHPDGLDVVVPPEPGRLQHVISDDVATLTLGVSALMILLGIVAIANTVALSVLERTPELGLRRVFGASPWHLARLVVSESVLIGTLGGFVGTAVGFVVVSAYSAWNGWAPVYDPLVLGSAPVAGVAVGIAAGLAPAARAARIEPSAALRR